MKLCSLGLCPWARMGNAGQVLPFDSFNLFLCVLVTIAQQGSFFVVAFYFKFDKVCERLPEVQP